MSKTRGRFWPWLGRGLRNLLLRNFWLKLVSLVFAVGFYTFIHSAQNVQRTVQVDLTQFLPPKSADRQLMTQIPDRISVTVAGPSSELQGLRGDDLGPVAMDLTDGKRRQFLFDASMLNLPPRVTVQRIVPALLDLDWEDVVSRKIPVQVVRTGEPASGFEVTGEPEIEPADVEVSGPESVIAVIQFVRAVDFDVTGLAEGEYPRQLALDRPADIVAFDSSYDVNSVLVTMRIGRKLATRTFEKLKVEVVGLPRALTRPATVDVTVTGLPERVERLRPEALIPLVEIELSEEESQQPGSQYAEVLLTVPEAKVDVTPSKVLVKWF